LVGSLEPDVSIAWALLRSLSVAWMSRQPALDIMEVELFSGNTALQKVVLLLSETSEQMRHRSELHWTGFLEWMSIMVSRGDDSLAEISWMAICCADVFARRSWILLDEENWPQSSLSLAW
jgi:hypothetical protein